MPNKALRNTMRVWLQKQKKKEEKATTAVATPPVDTTPAPAEASQANDATEKPVESVESAHTRDSDGAQAVANDVGDADQRAKSASATKEEVGLIFPISVVPGSVCSVAKCNVRQSFPKLQWI